MKYFFTLAFLVAVSSLASASEGIYVGLRNMKANIYVRSIDEKTIEIKEILENREVKTSKLKIKEITDNRRVDGPLYIQLDGPYALSTPSGFGGGTTPSLVYSDESGNRVYENLIPVVDAALGLFQN